MCLCLERPVCKHQTPISCAPTGLLSSVRAVRTKTTRSCPLNIENDAHTNIHWIAVVAHNSSQTYPLFGCALCCEEEWGEAQKTKRMATKKSILRTTPRLAMVDGQTSISAGRTSNRRDIPRTLVEITNPPARNSRCSANTHKQLLCIMYARSMRFVYVPCGARDMQNAAL